MHNRIFYPGWRNLYDPADPKRREFLRRTSALAGAAALGGLASRPARAQANTLNLLCWPGYTAPEVVGPFEEETGIRIVAKEYTGGDAMLALLSSSPPGTFDLILSDAEYVQMVREAGFMEKLDPASLPMEDFWPEFQEFPGLWHDGDMYAIMTSFGYLGMTYNAEQLTREEVSTYEVMWSDKLRGKVGMYDWYLPPMLCLSLRDGNHPPNDIDDAAFGRLRDTLFSLSGQMAGIGSFAGSFSMLSQAEAWVMPGTGAWLTLLLRQDGVPVDDSIPDEGGIQWSECMGIAAGTPNQEAALRFLQYMASPEGQVRVAIKPAYSGSIPSRAGWDLLNERHPDWADLLLHRFDQRNVMDEYKDGKIFLRDLPRQQSLDDWNRTFTEFKNMI